jgi:type II secretory pathway predicted ATPase ExeA
MLLEHFKLNVQPFGVTPDTRFLHLSQTHRYVLASLHYGIHSERGACVFFEPATQGNQP